MDGVLQISGIMANVDERGIGNMIQNQRFDIFVLHLFHLLNAELVLLAPESDTLKCSS